MPWENVEPKFGGFSEDDLRSIEADVRRIFVETGLPPESISNFRTSCAPCATHTECVNADIHISDDVSVHVAHCGCDTWLSPTDPPPSDLEAFAQDFAEDLVWYREWHRTGEAASMMVAIRDAVEAEIRRAAADGLDWSPANFSFATFDTFRGHRPHVVAQFNQLHNSLTPEMWSSPFWTAADVKKFFRSVRPYQRALARRRDELAAVGARGAVDAVAAAVFLEADCDMLWAAEITKLDPQSSRFKVGDGEVLLRWQMGTLQGRVDLAPGVRWDFGKIYFDDYEIVDRARYGRRLSEYFECALLPPDALVGTCDMIAGTIRIEPEVKLFRCENGVASWL